MELSIERRGIAFLPSREKKSKRKRIFEIDLLRGLLIIMMIVDHIAYDFAYLGPMLFRMSQAPEALRELSLWCYGYWDASWRVNFRYVVIACFFSLSGLSAILSRDSIKRGMQLIGFGAIISVIFYSISLILETNMFILFGIISTLGISLLAYSLLRLLVLKATGSRQAWKWVALFLALLFLVCGYWMCIETSTRTIDEANWWMVINGRYQNYQDTYVIAGSVFTPIKYNFATKVEIMLGLKKYGVDWSGIFPAIGYSFLGGFVGELLYAK
ncbi:MAG: heparan-alpha-glucosaminide N-acetyltransferase domain-containing protein, partial [Bacilli bacterium]